MSKHAKEPQGQGGTKEEITRISAEIRFMIFQNALARQRVKDIIMSDDLASAVWYRELAFVHSVQSDVDSLLRKVSHAARAEYEAQCADEA